MSETKLGCLVSWLLGGWGPGFVDASRTKQAILLRFLGTILFWK